MKCFIVIIVLLERCYVPDVGVTKLHNLLSLFSTVLNHTNPRLAQAKLHTI